MLKYRQIEWPFLTIGIQVILMVDSPKIKELSLLRIRQSLLYAEL